MGKRSLSLERTLARMLRDKQVTREWRQVRGGTRIWYVGRNFKQRGAHG